MDGMPRYKEDVFAWSQHQARLLRALRERGTGPPNELDLEHVAEEIEDLGLSELNGVPGHLEGMLVHPAKAVSSPEAPPVRKWLPEVHEHQSHAIRRFTPSMARRIDLDGVWRRALARAGADLALYGGALAGLPEACPFALDDLLSEAPNAEALAARLRPPAA